MLAIVPVIAVVAAVAVDEPAAVEVTSRVDAVVLYTSGAEVRRTTTVPLEAGVHELVFTGIPDPGGDGLPAVRASVASPFAVLGVDVAVRDRPVSEDPESLRNDVEAAELAYQRLEMEVEGHRRDLSLIEAVGVRAAGDATEAGGTTGLDLEVLAAQFEFVRTERTRLQSVLLDATQRLDAAEARLETARQALARSGEVSRETVATVRIAAPEAGEAAVSLRYLRGDAGWRPSYSVRSRLGEAAMPVEYEAIVRQVTGERWDDVELTLSTANPSSPRGPADLRPVFVDRRGPETVNYDAAMPESAADMAFVGGGGSGSGAARKTRAVEDAMRDAYVQGGGTAVTYALPSRVSIPSDRDRTARVRIASIDAPASRVLVTRPVIDEQVFLRVDLENASPFVLLEGSAALFVEGEYVGPTRLTEVPAGGRFGVWFGVDPSITVDRRLLRRDTRSTGLFNGGLQTTLEYRIDLRNDGDVPATIEVWDRRPVSRDGDIEVRVVDLSTPLSTNAEYLETDARQGLLKWAVTLDPGADEAITWTVRINRSSDLQTTPIPE